MRHDGAALLRQQPSAPQWPRSPGGRIAGQAPVQSPVLLYYFVQYIACLRPGRFRVDGLLTVRASGVVVRGLGPTRSQLQFTKVTSMTGRSHLTFVGALKPEALRPLAAEALALLDALPRIVGSSYFFSAVADASRPLSHATLAHALKRLCDRASIQAASAHVVRHRLATDVASAAPNIRTGMMITGHKSVQAFLGYVHGEAERAVAVADTVASRIAALGKTAPERVVVALPSERQRRRRRVQ